MLNTNGVKRNCCPKCGGQIIVSYQYQYSLDYKVLKSSQVSKKHIKTDGCGTGECFACCPKCGENWETDDFMIVDDCFIDLKYTECEVVKNDRG